MDDMINRHDSIAEENIEPNGRPAKDQFEEWSGEVADRADDVFKNDKKDGPIKDREKRIKEMDEVIEVVSKRWHNLFYILQFCYIFFWLCCFFLMHLATSCYIPIISGYK